ncbi:MAG: hypothetical protein ABI613_05520 [Gemmatimonadota bacterium]
MINRIAFTLFSLAGIACSGSDAPPTCGFAAVVGPTVLLDQFSTPNQTLVRAPDRVPEKLVARLAAGPAFSAIAGRADSQWVIGINGTLPPETSINFGVLVLDTTGKTLGVILYQGSMVEGAPPIGTVTVGAMVVPLIGIQLDPTRIQDERCPLFPDSLAQ